MRKLPQPAEHKILFYTTIPVDEISFFSFYIPPLVLKQQKRPLSLPLSQFLIGVLEAADATVE